MRLNEFSPGKTGSKPRKRIGRGPGSGWGTTGGRGQKGAGARKSPGRGEAAFEGGQMPLQRRLPKRGFKSPFVKDTQVVNLKGLNKVPAGQVDAKVLLDYGLIKSAKKPVKVLGFGVLEKSVQLKVNAISEKAKAAVEAAGGKVELL